MKYAIALTALLATTAHAEFFSGNDLLQKIEGEQLDRMLSLGYVMGVFDTARGLEHCPPDNITAGQVRDMVRRHLVANPENRHYTADLHVRAVLKKAWPCANRSNRSGGDV